MVKVLIIDDERPIRETLEMFLREKGYEVATSENGADGLRLIEKEPPDIVVLDIRLPGMNGLEVLQNIKKINKDTEVILITAYHDIGNNIEAIALGAYGYIRKPIDAAEFEVTIDKVVKNRTFHPQVLEPSSDGTGRLGN